MITSPFPPSTRDLIDGIRRENPTLTEAQAAYRLIGEKDAKILDLTAQLNQQNFLRGLWMRVALSLLGFMVIAAVGMWVRR